MAIYDPFLEDEDFGPRGPSDRPTVSDLRRASQAMLESYAFSDVDVDPVREILLTNEVARSFWGKTWCANLEGWSASRHKLARGRTCVRCGAVVNLRIFECRAFARVCGTGLCTVVVRVEPMAPERLTEHAVEEAVSATERGGLGPADPSAIFGVDVEDSEPGA